MSQSQSNARGRRKGWVGAAAIATLVGAGAFFAREQGWFDQVSWLQGTPFARHGAARSGTDDVPGPVDADELDLPREALLTQTEPVALLPVPDESEGPVNGRQNRSRYSRLSGSGGRFELEEGDDGAGDGGSPIITAAFEEEAPAAPSVPEEPEVRDGKSSGRDKSTLAGRPTDTAKAVSTPRAGQAGTTKGARLMDRKKIDLLIDDGKIVEAQKELSRWYWQAPAEREDVLPQLNKMAQALYFSPQPLYEEPYVVKAGDQLRVVGKHYQLSWEYLAKLNRVDAKKIRMGQKLKVVTGPFAAVVFLDRYELVLHLNGSFVKSYRVGVGKDGTTPLGTFTVKNKMVDPTYYGPEGVIAHDDPNNPLGERWIDIGDGFGIHGTIEPKSIGKNESRGCIRMLNSDVEEVYDFLVLGSEVKIQK